MVTKQFFKKMFCIRVFGCCVTCWQQAGSCLICSQLQALLLSQYAIKPFECRIFFYAHLLFSGTLETGNDFMYRKHMLQPGGPRLGGDFHPVAMKQRNISQIFAVLQKPVVYPLTLCPPLLRCVRAVTTVEAEGVL